MILDIAELEELRDAVKEALSTARRLDRCHRAYLAYREINGVSRARATTYVANSGNLATALKADISELRSLASLHLRLPLPNQANKSLEAPGD